MSARRTAGMNATRLSAILGEDVIGYIRELTRTKRGWNRTLQEGRPGALAWLVLQ
jgi:hypothetical protein